MFKAAAPKYLGQDFSKASPAMRFGMYFAYWGPNWEKPDGLKKEEWQKILKLGNSDRQLMQSLAKRHKAAMARVNEQDRFVCDAVATAPFVTGLGNEHPLENGFAFLSPYGLPYLAGSGVKGVLRQAATELARGDWGETHGWTAERIEMLFGPEAGDEAEDNARRGALVFHDVIPEIKTDSLALEIMTPHQGDYYQQKGGDIVPPHDSGQPVPIQFLAVPAGSSFFFSMACNRPLLEQLGKHHEDNLAGGDRWKTLLSAAFGHACQWVGFGAKTAVGYGAMAEDESARARRREEEQQAQEQAEREAELGQMSEAERIIHELHDKALNREAPLFIPAAKALEQGEWDDNEGLKLEIAAHIKSLMKKAKAWDKPKKKSNYKRTKFIKQILGED
ncbi:MAG TPA: type III-B CRISPR module RAMP protein Cmr6 [Wenzhouxiangella sp.]|nr:type III-B CRISPR module RAMP protein Cmr6 [Wenzhouxiangella sp.]